MNAIRPDDAKRLSQTTRQSGLVTLLFTDVVGSTALKQQLGDHAGVALVQEHHALVRKLLKQFPEAEEISSAGDSFFLGFVKPSDAVRFALLLQSGLQQFNQGRSVPLQDRVGLHLGEVVIEEIKSGKHDLHGMQVDTCARVMSLAQAGQILMTRPVFDNARQSLKGEEIAGAGSLSWLNHGRFELKGIEEPVEVCEVRPAEAAALPAPATSQKARHVEAAEGEAVLGWRPAVDQPVPNTQWVLEKKLGEGGFGEVWLGRHQKLKERRVFKFCFRADRVRSLKREMTLFRLIKERIGDHPNIVSLREVYFEEPPFYVEEDYVEGEDLASWCAAQGGAEKVPLAAKLEIVAQVADALQAAHDAGVIHRDVKPANILVSGRSSVISNQSSEVSSPKDSAHSPPTTRRSLLAARLTDFGIGQVISQELLKDVTRAGFTKTLIGSESSSHSGTQLYMAPELLGGKPASTRSDTYSLGVVLYQLWVGDFKQAVTGDWFDEITDPLLKDDLKHCLAGKPGERFAGVGELASRLRSWEERHQQLLEQERAERQVAIRHNLTLVSCGIAALLLVVAVALGFGLRRAEHQREAAERARKEQRRLAYASDMKAAQIALQQNNRSMALSLLRRFLPEPGEEDLRGIEWRYLWQECRPDKHENFPHPGMVYSAALSPDGNLLATACQDNKVRVWDVTSSRQLREFEARDLVAPQSIFVRTCVSFSPDGKWLASSGTNGIVIRSTKDWSLVKELNSASAPLSFSTDGRVLVTGSTNGMLFWNQEDWSCRVLTNVFASGKCFAVTPDGMGVACLHIGIEEVNTMMQAQIEFWDLRTGTKRTIKDTLLVGSLAISPDGKWLAYGDNSGRISYWDLVEWAARGSFQAHQGPVSGLAFSPDSKRLATGASDQQIHFWETGTTNRLGTRQGHERAIGSLEFSRDGRKLVSASRDETARVWDVVSGSEKTPAFSMPKGAWVFTAVPDGSGFIVADYKARAFEFRNLPGGQLVRTMPFKQLDPEGNDFRDVLGAPDGQSILGVTMKGTVHFFSPFTGTHLRSVHLGETNLTLWSVSPGDRWLMACSSDGSTGLLFDLRTGKAIQRFVDYWAVNGYSTFSPDGRWLAYATTNNVIKLWDLAASRERAVLKGHRATLFTLIFSPDSKLLASGDMNGDAFLWSAETARPLFDSPLKGNLSFVNVVAFSRDGRALATYGMDRTLRLWSVATGREMLLFKSEPWIASSYFDFPAPGDPNRRLLLVYEGPTQARATLIPSLAEIDEIEMVERQPH